VKKTQALEQAVRANPYLAPILDRFDEIGLPDCWLAAGAIAQTVWNRLHGREPAAGIGDIDLVYFDAGDLSEGGRQRAVARVRALFPDIPLPLDVQNEARIHLWYEEKFGYPIAQYKSSADAVATFPTTATSVGVRTIGGRFDVIATFGLEDLLNGIVRPNKCQITREIYEAKVARWRTEWPRLQYMNWK
jgi:hypothetical protein